MENNKVNIQMGRHIVGLTAIMDGHQIKYLIKASETQSLGILPNFFMGAYL